jgi:hypothetical protein
MLARKHVQIIRLNKAQQPGMGNQRALAPGAKVDYNNQNVKVSKLEP